MAKQTIVPLIVCKDIEAAQKYLVKVFGFKRGIIQRGQDGLPVHAEVSMKGSVIWIHRVVPKHGLVSAQSLKGVPGGLVVYVDDVDTHYERAKKAGAVIDSPPADQPYGQREYSARDIEGLRWYFATRK